MSAAPAPLSSDVVWRWLAAVPDPEIPVVSVVDLGIVRHVAVTDGAVLVRITPTYSGCPATSVIRLEIETALRAQGIDAVRVETVLSPPWSTRAISVDGRAKLAAYGIAPPDDAVSCAGGLAALKSAHVACPRCQSPATEVVSPFGSTPCKAAFRCTACDEPFDYFKAI